MATAVTIAGAGRTRMPARPPARTPAEVRLALAHGLAAAIAEKGYAASTIADIVARARASKRTFYEHFTDKEECLLALYSDVSDALLRVLRSAGHPGQPWRARVCEVVAGYLDALDAMPAVYRAVLVEMQAAGPRAYRLRQQTQRRFAETLVEIVAAARPANPQLAPLPPALAVALVGGINELLLQSVDPYAGAGPGRPHPAAFAALHDPVVQLVHAVLAYRA
jgi:AcrR family transcriptional regulator